MRKFWKNQKGLTMMEVLVTVALLAIVVVPCLSSFVIAQRGNVLAKQTYNEYTQAQNLMEELKGTDYAEVLDKLKACKADKEDGIDVIFDDAAKGYFEITVRIGEPEQGQTDSDGEIILKGVIAP